MIRSEDACCHQAAAFTSITKNQSVFFWRNTAAKKLPATAELCFWAGPGQPYQGVFLFSVSSLFSFSFFLLLLGICLFCFFFPYKNDNFLLFIYI
jgi:hypothetical protein